MQKRTIPKQANFNTLNPRIKASDHIVVPTHTQPWTAARMVALVNNYGAAGSNAAIVVQDYQKPYVAPQPPALAAYPIVLSAKSAISLQLYMGELKRFVCAANVPLGEIAYALSRRQNPAFEYRTAFSTEDIAGLTATLDRLNVNKGEAGVTRTAKRPVVLAFGGQTGRTVTVSRDLYDTSLLFRNHLVR